VPSGIELGLRNIVEDTTPPGYSYLEVEIMERDGQKMICQLS